MKPNEPVICTICGKPITIKRQEVYRETGKPCHISCLIKSNKTK